MKCCQIDRKREHATAKVDFRPVAEAAETCELVDEVPDAFVVGVKDVWAVLMDMDATDVVGVTVSRDMATFLDHQALCARIGHLSCEDRAKEAGSDDYVVIHPCLTSAILAIFRRSITPMSSIGRLVPMVVIAHFLTVSFVRIVPNA